MRSFFKFFAERHLLAHLITLMTILLGVSTLTQIKRDIWPEVDLGVMIITTRYPGASPEDVELNVTNKIEEELKGVTGIERMTSVSMENISVVNVVIDPDAKDQEEVQNEVREAVNRVTDFPVEVTESPTVTEIKTSIFPVIEVGITGDLPYGELREIARRFEKKLEALPGVSSVERFGYRAREVKVEVSPEAIQEYQIPLREIISAIRARNIRATGGSFESYTSEKDLVTLAQFRDPLEVREVIVRSTFEGPVIKVKDLAIVKDDFEDERVLSRMNGQQAISFTVNKKATADAIRTVDAVKELAEKESANLPDGVEILYSRDFSRYVRNRFNIVGANGLIGGILVLIVLSLFLSFRNAFWVALGIPVSLLGTIFLMPQFDVYLDGISLAAMIIVLGIIVDDAIIISENIQRHREKGDPPLVAAVEGIREVYAPVVTTILTTFLAFAPLFLMTGMLGDFVYVIPLVISLALFVSLFEATVALPAHLIRGFRRSREGTAVPPRQNWFGRLEKPCGRVIFRLLRFRYAFLGLFIVLLVVSLWYAATFMSFTLFPSSMADEFYVLIELPTGTSLEATSDRVREVEQIVLELPEDELGSFVTRIGSLEGFAAGENENWAIISVSLTPFAQRERSADQIVEELRQKTDGFEGYEKVTYSIEGGGPPVGKPITIRVVGSNDMLRAQLADSVEAFLGTLEGVKDIDRDDKLGKDQVEIKVDYDKLSRLGLTVADVAQGVRIAYDGEVVTSVRYGDEDIDFRVMLQEKARRQLKFLSELTIPNRRGRLIPLGEAARFETGPGPSNFYHFNKERAITITADITKGETTPLEATEATLNHFDLDSDWTGMRFAVGGEAEETQESMRSLFRAFMLAAIGIYFLLILLFNSPTQPLMVMAAIPFGIMGVILAFALHGEPLGFVAMLGVIGLAGVVVNDSLVLVNHINRLTREQTDVDMRELVAEGTSHRFRPVVVTTLTTTSALLPLAYGIGGSDPYMAPMALALAYGLLFATPITLILVPSLYMVRNDIGRIVIRGCCRLGLMRSRESAGEVEVR
ncbi:MAG: efflux RND transporter permease subunit [Candidatus Eiseniibacteriota bacterium]|nr:MAG: efflux RND transporter permease subunit [Candidatus Eisenbacteria bacterium]